MRLHEEYLKRHDLGVRVVCYDTRSSILLKSRETPIQWKILNCVWLNGGVHPGCFEVSNFYPVHNGFQTGLLKGDSCSVFWEQYEPHILGLVDTLRPNFTAVVRNERYVALWYMFLQMYDSFFVKLNQPKLVDLFFESIDERTVLADKHNSIERAERILRDVCPNVYEIWVYQVKVLANCYSEWLECLFNE